VPGTRWNLDALPIHGLVSGTLMFFLLHQRSRQLVKAGLEAELDLAFTRRELELERGQRDLQNRFVAMLTHELKTPLSVVRITLDTMRAAGEPRRLIDCALDNMNAIIERCNYADLLDRQQLEQSREPCDLSAVLAEAVARSPAPERVSVSAERVPRVHADRLLLGVLLGNLIDNALKYSPEGAPVDIRIARGWQAGRPVVTVAISNPPGRAGLPDPERVFAKFYRSPGAHSSSGSGLGLYIVRGIAELLGGQIVYRAKEGEAEFSLWLPC
jgi:signal transduction histidine kinase